MAAPPNKQSPSNQKMHESGSGTQENRLKDPPPASVPPAAAASPSPVATPPSYKKSETCESYVLAKQLLNNDNFEEALTVIEEELIRTTTEIRLSLGLSPTPDPATTNADLETEIELHEALAPLHYLYGTTLLYSLEEAKGDGNDTGAMMTEAGAMASTTATPAAAAASMDPTNPWAHLSEPNTGANNASGEDAAATAEDIQIAWENLEAARTIVEKMLLQASTAISSGMPEIQVAKLQLDLAQIHLREGDLQRINGNYTSAIGDYSSCLEILLRHNNTKDEYDNLRDLNRKIADTQFNLGLTYLTSSSDLQKEVAGANANASANPGEASGNASTTADQREKAAILAREHCEKGIQQHVDCARTFCGIVAKLCGVAPETILKLSEIGKSEETDASAKKPVAGFKTTGLDDESDDKKVASSATADASQTLNVWRMALAKMILSNSPSDPHDSLRVNDILQVLDEIQETIDEAERSQEGVLQAAEIRVKAQQAAAAMDGDSGAPVANPDGSTTTIGFGQAAASVAAKATVNAAPTRSKPATVSDAKPMMIVKKKKKRKDSPSDGSNTGDIQAKKPPQESESNKRAKTD
eukprot:CAMPEP_0116131506 /NCGR_PEP_ID=MMETSP0329-20121206/9044_1 /TAXON_ID=697910 /ORGANISM="Pseudo-nitzschia arenysensis, Strain B593" /LENGTH=585 /DNA_ID=CAMNT_0003625945 /DNA_START=133 /DNA_END=1890 /DNA_ORIENTATION=-